MLPCEVLENIQSDLKEIVKFSCVPFEKKYKLAPGVELDLVINEPENVDSYEVSVSSSSGVQEAKLNGYRKIPALLVGLTCQKLTEYLSTRKIDPCDSMNHGGADEILALYGCIKDFAESPIIPFKSTAMHSGKEFENFSVDMDGSRYRIVLTTNHIYGESIKTIYEVDSQTFVSEIVYEQLERMLGEWIRPESVKAVKLAITDLERSQAESS